MPELSVKIGRLLLKNPILSASGTYGYGLDFRDYYDPSCLGGIITKGLSLHPHEGNPPPRIVETPCGMLNSIGLANVGVKEFLERRLPLLSFLDTHLIANIYGRSVEEYGEVARVLAGAERISALEVNISCPNVKEGGMLFGADPQMAYGVTKRVREVYPGTVIMKLSPNVTDIVPILRAVEEAGADAVSLINTLRGMAVDIYTRRPRLGSTFGGLSGPAIRPIALYFVYKAVKTVNIPVIGVGGIRNAEDAMEFLVVGARAVEIGTGNFLDPYVPINVLKGINQFMERYRIDHIDELIGSLRE